MSLQLYPPFSDADLRSPTLDYEAIPDAIFDKAKIIRQMQVLAHESDRHEYRRHPWCTECEFREVAVEVEEDGIDLLTPAQLEYYRSEVKRVGAATAIQITRDLYETEPEKARDLELLDEEIRSRTAKRYTPETYAAMLRIAESEAIYADYEIGDIARNVSDRRQLRPRPRRATEAASSPIPERPRRAPRPRMASPRLPHPSRLWRPTRPRRDL